MSKWWAGDGAEEEEGRCYRHSLATCSCCWKSTITSGVFGFITYAVIENSPDFFCVKRKDIEEVCFAPVQTCTESVHYWQIFQTVSSCAHFVFLVENIYPVYMTMVYKCRSLHSQVL